MEGFELFEQSLWNPLAFLGFTSDAFKINVSTVKNTWFVLFILFMLLIIIRFFLTRPQNIIRHLTIQTVQAFIDLIFQTVGHLNYAYLTLITSLFIFILFCNCIIVIPWTTEPTSDLNTTVALSLIAFFYKEIETIRVHGFFGYFKEFLEPFFVMFPINVIGHFSKVVSLAFRLFGNIFGGSVIMELYTHAIAGNITAEIIGLLTGLNFLILLFFGIFEGLIQAFVFTMLTLTYLTIGIAQETDGEL